MIRLRNLLTRFFKSETETRRVLTKKAARKANRYYRLGIFHFQDEAVKLTSQLTDSLPPIRKLFLNFLAERVLQGALHANFLHREYPYSSHADIAGINRGMIEASVNYLYLLNDSNQERLAAFWAKSACEESIRNDGLKKWIDDSDQLIKFIAKCDYEPALRSSDHVLKQISKYTGIENPNPNAWPKFKQRCIAEGKTWQFIYDMEYKAMSSWQHGDPSRIIISPSFARIDPKQGSRNVFESLGLTLWTFTVLYLFVRELAIRADGKIKIEALDQVFWNVSARANGIIEEFSKRFQPDKCVRSKTS